MQSLSGVFRYVYVRDVTFVAFMKFWQRACEESNLPFQVAVSYFSLFSCHRDSFPEVLLSTMMHPLQQEQLPACAQHTNLRDVVLLLLSPRIDS